MIEILKLRPDAIFIQSESSEYFHADSPAAIGPAEVLNSRRFLTLDLNYGRRVDSEMYEYLMDNGMTREELAPATTASNRSPPTTAVGVGCAKSSGCWPSPWWAWERTSAMPWPRSVTRSSIWTRCRTRGCCAPPRST